MEIIGLVPASGIAERLGRMPFSKELLPAGRRENGALRVVSEHLLGYYRQADIHRVIFIIRKGKWDIPGYFGDGSWLNMHFAYAIMNHPDGVPWTLNQAYAHTAGCYVALGFPDIIVSNTDAYSRLKIKIAQTSADIVLGLYPTENPEKADMVRFDHKGDIQEIVIKSSNNLQFAWINCIWSPAFWDFFHQQVGNLISNNPHPRLQAVRKSREIYPGDIINLAIESGMKAAYVCFDDERFLDTGTLDDLSKTGAFLDTSDPIKQ